ncbi:MAG: sialidase family protein [Fuerstiella sp.]
MKDEGKTWSGGLMIDEREDVTYPDGVQADDGRIYIIYDHQRTPLGEVLLATFSEEDVRRRVKKLRRTQSAAFHTIYGVTDWRRINRLRLRCFRFRKCKNLLHLTVGGFFWPYAISLWGGGVVTIAKVASLDRFQAQPIWEIPE